MKPELSVFVPRWLAGWLGAVLWCYISVSTFATVKNQIKLLNTPGDDNDANERVKTNFSTRIALCRAQRT